MNRVVAEPGTCAVRATTGESDVDTQAALATGLDDGVRRLHEYGEVAHQPIAMTTGKPAEPVAGSLDLFAVVEDECVVARRRVDLREVQHDRKTTLHVRRTAAEQPVAVTSGRDVVGDRHGVEMAGDDDSL